MLSKSYNAEARERGNKPVVFILMRVMLNIESFINDERYDNYLSSTSFDQMNVQFPISVYYERIHEK